MEVQQRLGDAVMQGQVTQVLQRFYIQQVLHQMICVINKMYCAEFRLNKKDKDAFLMQYSPLEDWV